jgi:hypothetical protein
MIIFENKGFRRALGLICEGSAHSLGEQECGCSVRFAWLMTWPDVAHYLADYKFLIDMKTFIDLSYKGITNFQDMKVISNDFFKSK